MTVWYCEGWLNQTTTFFVFHYFLSTCFLCKYDAISTNYRFFSSNNKLGQKVITRSLHLPYIPPESTLSFIFLFLEALRRGALVGVFTIANHKRPMVSHYLRHIRIWRMLTAVRMFSVIYKYSSSKNRKIQERVDSRATSSPEHKRI